MTFSDTYSLFVVMVDLVNENMALLQLSPLSLILHLCMWFMKQIHTPGQHSANFGPDSSRSGPPLNGPGP